MAIHVSNWRGVPRLPTARLHLLLQHICHILGLAEYVDVSFMCCDDRQMQALNKRFRQQDKPTDVLAFPQWDAAAHGILTAARLQQHAPAKPLFALGDVVISLPMAQRQATARQHSLEQEMRCLLVHGVLHLLGHDHVDEGRMAQRMRRCEQRVLSRLAALVKETVC